MKYLLSLLLFAAGCATTQHPDLAVRLTTEEKDQLTRRAKPPQTFGLTAYDSPDGAIFAGAFRQHANHIGRLEFASDRNSTAPIIEINGGKATMLIDTAASESWLTSEAMVELKAIPMVGPALFERTARHVYDTTGGFAVVVPTIVLDKAHVQNAVFYARNAKGPLEGLTRWERTPRLDGVLGADFLRSFEFVRIGSRGRKVVVSGGSVYPYSENAVTAIPLVDVQGGLGIEVMLNGEPTIALLDLAGDFEVALESMETPMLRQLTLGNIVFRRVEVVSVFELGLGRTSPPRIGRQLLERYDLVFNQKGRQLLLEKPTE